MEHLAAEEWDISPKSCVRAKTDLKPEWILNFTVWHKHGTNRILINRNHLIPVKKCFSRNYLKRHIQVHSCWQTQDRTQTQGIQNGSGNGTCCRSEGIVNVCACVTTLPGCACLQAGTESRVRIEPSWSQTRRQLQCRCVKWRHAVVGSIVPVAILVRRAHYSHHCWLGSKFNTPTKQEKMWLKVCSQPF